MSTGDYALKVIYADGSVGWLQYTGKREGGRPRMSVKPARFSRLAFIDYATAERRRLILPQQWPGMRVEVVHRDRAPVWNTRPKRRKGGG